MIHWKVSTLSLAFGAAATFGFVWLSRSSRSRRRVSTPSPLPPTSSKHLPIPDDVARTDAIRDLHGDSDMFEAIEADELDMRSLDEQPLAGDEPVVGDEHYDAIDPEEMGTEWLRRATETAEPLPSSPNPFTDEGADVAAELPVGLIDSEGNTELHQPERDQAAGAELSPNEAELVQREGPKTDAPKPNEPNG